MSKNGQSTIEIRTLGPLAFQRLNHGLLLLNPLETLEVDAAPLFFPGMCELTLFADNVKGVSLQNMECMKRITWSLEKKVCY